MNLTMPQPQGPATVTLAEESFDLSPAVDSIVAHVREALKAGQQALLLLGEEHTTVFNVRLAELVRRRLRQDGLPEPLMAEEIWHNILEDLVSTALPDFCFPSGDLFRAEALKALAALKQDDPPQYRRLQTLACAVYDWPYAPATRLANYIEWMAADLEIRPVDLATARAVMPNGLRRLCFDLQHPDTSAFVKEHAANVLQGTTSEVIRAFSSEGIHLRNLYMAAQLRELMAEGANPVTILQTGASHLGGGYDDGNKLRPYEHSLHALFTQAARQGGARPSFRTITVFAAHRGYRSLCPQGRDAVNTPDTVILQGGPATQHFVKEGGSFEKEIDTLKRLTPGIPFQNEAEFKALRTQMETRLYDQIKTITVAWRERIAPALAPEGPAPTAG
jgi:hypothetical protein